MDELSITMRHAANYARAHGGELERFPGGYWCEGGRTQWDAHRAAQTFSTSTVQALVTRGVAEYSEWKDGRNGAFPVRMRLTPSLPQESVNKEKQS